MHVLVALCEQCAPRLLPGLPFFGSHGCMFKTSGDMLSVCVLHTKSAAVRLEGAP